MDKWSKEFKNCINCGTTERQHYANGLCRKCYRSKYEKSRYQGKRKEYLKQKGKENYQEFKEFIDNSLGIECYFCGFSNPNNKKNGFEKHEKSGAQHLMIQKYYYEHINDFVLLCVQCHKGVHWCMKYLGLEWIDIEKMFKFKHYS